MSSSVSSSPSLEPTNGHTYEEKRREVPTLDNLLSRCNTLIAELEAFKEHLKSRKQEHHIEIAHFRNTVKSELKTLERLTAKSNAQSRDVTQHTVNSSNLPFLETVWNTVKNSTGLQALQKRFYWNDGPPVANGSGRRINGSSNPNSVPPSRRKQSALVDIVTQDGLEWVKVSLITNTRLLFDKAKQGWEDASSSEEEEEEEDEPSSDVEGNDVPIVRMTKDLLRASETVRIRTKHPQLRLVFPKIEEGQIAEIDAILEKLRSMGAIVECFDHAPKTRPLADIVDNLLTDPFARLTPTLNIDCTILLALVSDFSHCTVSAEPWFHRALKRQVEIEDKENLLPNLLYPAIAEHDLVCTHEAAKRMREIVVTIGTPGEKARTAILMGDATEKNAEELRAELQDWTRFEVPSTLRLPIQIVDGIFDSEKLPSAASAVKDHLTSINQSVFLYGWAENCSTITSNRTVVKQIENLLAANADSEDDWPNIWLCPTARSLVGKEKGRREG